MSPYDLASRYIGTVEATGKLTNPLILAMLQLDNTWPKDDEVPWCSAFVNWIAWNLDLPRSKSLRARSWLEIGQSISIPELLDNPTSAKFSIVVLKQHRDDPNKEVIKFRGHVGFYAGLYHDNTIQVLGGNQSNAVNTAIYHCDNILDIRCLT